MWYTPRRVINAGDITLFQKFLMEEVDEYWSNCQATRTSMLQVVQDYELQFRGEENSATLAGAHVNVLQTRWSHRCSRLSKVT